MLAHDVWHAGTDTSAEMPTGMAITTAVSTAGMDGVRSTTHGIILRGMVLAIGMIHGTMILGTTAIQDGTADGMVGDHITHITTTGDGTDTTILYMEVVVDQNTMVQDALVLPITVAFLMVALHLHSDLVAASVLASQTGIERIV